VRVDKNPAGVLTALNRAAFAAAVGSFKPTTSTSGLPENIRHRMTGENARLIPQSVAQRESLSAKQLLLISPKRRADCFKRLIRPDQRDDVIDQ
jgi:hypothetical protein